MQTSKKIDLDDASGFISFPAIRGVQASREFYTAMVPFKQIPRIFVFNEYEVPPNLRAQRNLNVARVPSIAKYVINNKNDYVFSALTASIDGKMDFLPIEKKSPIGEIKISMNATLIINDGQHRRAAIEKVLEERPDLAYESIPVVFFVDLGLARSQQMFADLNKNAVRPSRSLSILYNIRDNSSREVLDIIQKVELFKGKIELEKTSISKRSTKLFTLSSLYSACSITLEDDLEKKELKRRKALLIEYFNILTNIISPWKEVLDGRLTPAEFRMEYVCSHGILLESLGYLATYVLENYPNNWKEKIQSLSKIDWLRSDEWEGVALNRGRMSRTQANLEQTIKYLKNQIE
ncbi:MAG: DNA sulfur modification protein DndB [Candidatus Heimdallarchaeota archaeon]|nr:DNA sulfur modification protein DndB [Candidatus Heimdallarchaeota archaeon]MDH5645317.1 DNA sulfur modification protein DndB [Candidatus Heimdallarchaeota archaeon]